MPKSPVPKKKFAKALVLSRRNAPARAKHRKSSQEEIYERRQMVMRLRLKGKTHREIAKELGVGTMTVRRDMQAIKEHVAAKVEDFEKDQALGESLHTYDLIHKEAWVEYNKCAHGSTQRVQFLNLIRAAENDRVKMLMDVGLISKNPVKVEHTHKSDEVLAGLTKDAQQLIAMALLKAQLRPPGEPVLDTLPGGNGESKALPAAREVIEAEASVGDGEN
jgi:transcriptional regulator